MTLLNPYLFLRRLIVISSGIRVYDESFHDGVNIIRGYNSSGKSTIADFIFFVLGGDFSEWKPEAARCDLVLAEVEINDKLYTFRRSVTELNSQPVEVFFGTIDEAQGSVIEGWLRFPLRRSDNKESFSQFIFKALGFPEVRGEKGSNITMHQMLRLLTVDQLSKVHSIMRDEEFDSALTRRTVSDVLFGVYDDGLYQDELRLRELRKMIDEANGESRSLKNVLNEAGLPTSSAQLDANEKDLRVRIDKIEKAIEAIPEEGQSPKSPDDKLEVNRQRVRQARENLRLKEESLAELDLVIQDSFSFIKLLELRLRDLDDGRATEEQLSNLFLQICPECLQPVATIPEAGHCPLCKQDVLETGRKGRLARIQHELEQQLDQSTRAQEIRVNLQESMNTEVATLRNQLRNAEEEFLFIEKSVTTPRNAELDTLYETLGGLRKQLEIVDLQKKLTSKMEESSKRVERLKLEIFQTEGRIRGAHERQDSRRLEADAKIANYVRNFLRNDLHREAAFDNVNEVVVNFDGNICEIDGRVNFSASSITYLKASVHFSIFFASLDLPFFRYPRFLVHDNIEDKGMEERRSQNLQRQVVDLSKRSEVRHQIILTTSMIAPDLDNENYCIGPRYDDTHKTLRFPENQG